MKNIKLVLEYVGTNYCGFQKQNNGVSVQQVLEQALFQAIGEQVTTYPSGRTDAGVHAMGQVVNFYTNTTIEPEKLAVVINFHLPPDIRVLSSTEVSKDFHARKSVKSKTYIYKIYLNRTLSVFDEHRALACGYNLDVPLMNQACRTLVGTHDFSSFVASNATTKTTTRTIYNCNFEKNGNYLIFTITGNGFLYNMVRIIVGTLLEIGTHKKPAEIMQTLLQGNNRKLAGKTVSPDGLYLKEVNY